VDDEELYRRALERILSRVGHGVSTARNAAEAMTVVTSGPLDLVLCDVKMPGISGLELSSGRSRTSTRTCPASS
jgi:YesN/AraC family two-component response regulator